MDGCSSKRNRSGIVVPRNECNLLLRNKIDTEDRNAQFCNRIGCSGRLKYSKSSPLDCAEKPKYSRLSIRASNGKEIVGSSSRTCFPITTARMSPQDSPRKFSSHLEPHSSKSCGVQGESYVTKLISTRGRNHQTQLQPKVRALSAGKVASKEVESSTGSSTDSNCSLSTSSEASVSVGSAVGSSSVGSKDKRKGVPRQKHQPGFENVLTGSSADSNCSLSTLSEASVSMGSAVLGSSRVGSKDKPKYVPCQKPRSGYEHVLTGRSTDSNCSFSTSSEASVSMGSATRNHSSGNRYGLRNIKCNPISDVIPRGGSRLESKIRRDMLKKRIPEGESSSSSKGKRGSVAPSKDEHVFRSISGISLSSSRRNRNWASNHDSITSSVMTRRSVNANTRITRSNPGSTTALSVTEVQNISPRLSRHEMHDNDNHISPYLSSMGYSSNASSSEQTGDNVPGIATFTFMEHGVTQGLRRHNLSGTAEVLLALERIEQDEEFTYEQLLVLENNLFFGNIYFYDQHREMRMDIDSMSYEELLALGDRMGTVSTALSEEAFAKCVRRTIYQATSLDAGCGGCIEDEADIKCSICQEEYAISDEIGKLGCEHGYHVACLQQWLRLKNWCPICKVSAAP